MTHNIENTKINEAVDILIGSDSDFSNVLGKEGLCLATTIITVRRQL